MCFLKAYDVSLQALQPRHKGNTLSTVIQTVDVERYYPERKHYWEEPGKGFSAPTLQHFRSAEAVSPGGMSSSLEHAAFGKEEDGEITPTSVAGVAGGDGVLFPPSEPDEKAGVLPLSGHTSCPGTYHSESEDSTRSDAGLL